MDARALRRMATEADEQHREAMRTMPADLHERHFSTADPDRTASRRRFLGTVGLGGAAIAIAGISVPVLGGVAGAQAADEPYAPDAADLQLATFAWALELTAAAAYGLAADTTVLTSGEAEVVRLFGGHHRDHALAFETLLGTVKGEEVGGTTSTTAAATPIQSLVDGLGPQITGAPDAASLMQVLLSIEEGAAATYLLALGNLDDTLLAESAAKILPVESQHAVVWSQLLEVPIEDYLPAFQTTADAFDPASYAG